MRNPVHILKHLAAPRSENGKSATRPQRPPASGGRAARDAGGDPRYGEWEREHRPTPDELESQRQHSLPQAPLITVIVTGGAAGDDRAARTRRSIERQTYGAVEVATAESGEMHVAGDYVAFVAEGDLLREDALFHIATTLCEHPATALVYTDEDTVDGLGAHSRPQFKPDFNLDYLYSRNFLGNLLVASRELFARALGSQVGRDGTWRYELALIAAEDQLEVRHIPRVLYHRLEDAGADAWPGEPGAEVLADERRALGEHLERRGLHARIETSSAPATLRTTFSPGDNPPPVSIIIPNMDYIHYLGPCLDSIYEKAGYPDFEIVIVDNNSTEQETFGFYRRMEDEHANLRVVTAPSGPFNYSRVVNLGAAHARGELLLLLNNDTSVITDGFLDIMAGYFTRPEVGVVGPLLLFPDGLVQHAGLSLMRSGTLGFMNQGLLPDRDLGYLYSLACPFAYSAVLGACQMVRASTFRAVGGYDEKLAITCNDLDFCWKVRRIGLEVVYTPHVRLFHKEFGSRGSDTQTPERTLQGIAEFERIRDKWPTIYRQGDGMINPNCADRGTRFELSDIVTRTPRTSGGGDRPPR